MNSINCISAKREFPKIKKYFCRCCEARRPHVPYSGTGWERGGGHTSRCAAEGNEPAFPPSLPLPEASSIHVAREPLQTH